jgi:hypothetical protein
LFPGTRVKDKPPPGVLPGMRGKSPGTRAGDRTPPRVFPGTRLKLPAPRWLPGTRFK